MLREWRYHFENHILERGYDLYYRGCVDFIRQENNQFFFEVQGKNRYHVKITVVKDHVRKIECDCPYFLEGQLCKHEAACLIYLENTYQHPSNLIDQTRNIVQQMPEALKNELLMKVLIENQELLEKVKQELHIQTSNYDKQAAYLNHLFIQYGYHREDTMTFENNLHLFMEEVVRKYISNHQEDIALAHLKHILSRLKHLMMEESQDVFNKELEMEALNELSDIQKNPQYTKEIFEFLCADFTHEPYLDFIFDYFREEPYLSVKLHYINQAIKKAEQFEAWAKDYYLERYYLKKILVLYDLKDEAQLTKITSQYYQYPKIREFWIEEAIAKKDYDKAIEMIQTSKEMDATHVNLLLKYERMLVDLYELTNDKKYLPCLRNLLFNLDAGEFDDYLRYKQALPEEVWLKEREDLLKVQMIEERYLDILLSEGLYEPLMEQISKSHHLYYLERHIADFEKQCPELLSEVYGQIALYYLKEAKKREDYQMIASLIQKMCLYPHGKEDAKRMISYIYQTYPHKRALHDEIKKGVYHLG